MTESGKGEGYKILVKLGNAWVKKKKSCLRWFCHVQRRAINALVKKEWVDSSQGNRKKVDKD